MNAGAYGGETGDVLVDVGNGSTARAKNIPARLMS